MYKVTHLILHGILFLILYTLLTPSSLQVAQKVRREKSPLFLAHNEHRIINYLKNWNKALLIQAYVTGEKRALSSKSYRNHRRLYLLHLFTPSALHLSICITFLLFFLRPTRKRPRLIRFILLLINLLVYFLLPQLFAVHRIAIFNIAKFVLPKFGRYKLFVFAFFFDFILGGVSRSPLSFLYSFLFLGAIVSYQSRNLIQLFISILFAQLLLSFTLQQPFMPLNFSLGFLYTIVFSFSFPLFILYYYLPLNVLTPLLNLFFYFQDIVFQLSLPKIALSTNLFLVLLTMYMIKRTKRASLALTLVILLYSPAILNFPDRKFLKGTSRRVSYQQGTPLESKFYSRGIKTIYKKRVCYHTLYINYYKKYCRKN